MIQCARGSMAISSDICLCHLQKKEAVQASAYGISQLLQRTTLSCNSIAAGMGADPTEDPLNGLRSQLVTLDEEQAAWMSPISLSLSGFPVYLC